MPRKATKDVESTKDVKKPAEKLVKSVVKKAVAKEGVVVYNPAKPTGRQNKLKYINMATLFYEFTDTEKWYMNFTVQLLLGVRNNGKHLQYAINKIDIIQQKNT